MRRFGPYFELGRVRATFAPGLDPAAGLPFRKQLNAQQYPVKILNRNVNCFMKFESYPSAYKCCCGQHGSVGNHQIRDT